MILCGGEQILLNTDRHCGLCFVLCSDQCASGNMTCPNGTPTVADGSGATLCETDGSGDCSECDAGYGRSAAAGSGEQTCEGNHTFRQQTSTPSNELFDTFFKCMFFCLLVC